MENVAVPSVIREQRLEQWITQYADTIMRLCFVYLHDIGQAQDAVQETFLKAWKGMDQFERRNGCSEQTWLMRIAINVCRDYHRSRWFRHMDRSKTPEELLARVEAVLPGDHPFAGERPSSSMRIIHAGFLPNGAPSFLFLCLFPPGLLLYVDQVEGFEN